MLFFFTHAHSLKPFRGFIRDSNELGIKNPKKFIVGDSVRNTSSIAVLRDFDRIEGNVSHFFDSILQLGVTISWVYAGHFMNDLCQLSRALLSKISDFFQ